MEGNPELKKPLGKRYDIFLDFLVHFGNRNKRVAISFLSRDKDEAVQLVTVGQSRDSQGTTACHRFNH
jgi:hypothetical protein